MGLIIFLFSALLAINMGASGFSVAFAPSFGSNILKRYHAISLYTLCVILGGVLIGPRVGETLMRKITYFPLGLSSGVIIISSCGLAMFLSNLLKVPQSTSFVTVASFIGTGLYFGSVDWWMVFKIFFFALFFSICSLVLNLQRHINFKSFCLGKSFLPVRDIRNMVMMSVVFDNFYGSFQSQRI